MWPQILDEISFVRNVVAMSPHRIQTVRASAAVAVLVVVGFMTGCSNHDIEPSEPRVQTGAQADEQGGTNSTTSIPAANSASNGETLQVGTVPTAAGATAETSATQVATGAAAAAAGGGDSVDSVDSGDTLAETPESSSGAAPTTPKNTTPPAVGDLNAPGQVQPPPLPENPRDSKDCADFANQAQAQEWFLNYKPFFGDVANLDPDGNNVACDNS